MKVGNIINGLKVTDVKRVNKLNLIQFLKEVDSYLKQGYQIDVNSARQVGLVLQADMFKTEASSSRVGSVGDKVTTESVDVESKEVEVASDDTSVPESTVQQDQVTESVVKEETPVSPKKTTTRSKKTAQ